jgi:hypothetical protein
MIFTSFSVVEIKKDDEKSLILLGAHQGHAYISTERSLTTTTLFLLFLSFSFLFTTINDRRINRKSCAKSSSTLTLVPTYRLQVLAQAWKIGAANRSSR